MRRWNRKGLKKDPSWFQITQISASTFWTSSRVENFGGCFCRIFSSGKPAGNFWNNSEILVWKVFVLVGKTCFFCCCFFSGPLKKSWAFFTNKFRPPPPTKRSCSTNLQPTKKIIKCPSLKRQKFPTFPGFMSWISEKRWVCQSHQLGPQTCQSHPFFTLKTLQGKTLQSS